MRGHKDAMPDGWEAFPPVHVVRGLRPGDEL